MGKADISASAIKKNVMVMYLSLIGPRLAPIVVTLSSRLLPDIQKAKNLTGPFGYVGNLASSATASSIRPLPVGDIWPSSY